MGTTNFPNGITSQGMPVTGGGLPATFGTYYYVDYDNGSDNNNGLSMDTAVKTIGQAHTLATTNKHDVIVLSGYSAHAQTEMLSITKNRLHFVGATGRVPGIGMGARARVTMGVTTAATDLGVMQNTGVGNTFTNIKFDSGNTVAESLYTVVEAGEYSIYNNCEFYKSTDLDETAAAEIANNGDSAQWLNCYIGSTAVITADNKIRPCMLLTGGIVSGKKCRDNYVENCVFARKAGGTEVNFIYGANATDVERMFVLKGCTFFNNPLSAATPAAAIAFGAAQTEGAVFCDATTAVVDVTVMGTTGQNIFVVSQDGSTYATAGLSVQA